jgi:hypothetical protein
MTISMQPPQTTQEYNVREEGGASLNSKLCELCVNLEQVYDLVLVPFILTICILYLM